MNGIRDSRYLSRQNGSVLVYCLGILVLIVLSVGYSFNASRVSAEKLASKIQQMLQRLAWLPLRLET